MKAGRWLAAGAAFLLVIGACAPPNQKPAANFTASPTPPPSPTPTDPLVAATPPSFHVGEVGVGYAPIAFSATGGRAPYTWTVNAGQLPAGLNLGADGHISGTPTGAGTFAFTIQVADSGDSTAKVDGKISIAAALSASLLPACAQYCNVELGCVTVCGTFGQLTGGVGPFSYALTQGPLPAGTSLAGLSLTGTFIGQAGWLQFAVQITDDLGAVASVAPRFWMYDHISLMGGSIPVSRQNACFAINAPKGPCTESFAFAGGTPNATTPTPTASWITTTCAPLPTLSVGGGQLTIAVNSGLPNNCNGWTATLRVVLTNQDMCGPGANMCSATADYTITVLPT